MTKGRIRVVATMVSTGLVLFSINQARLFGAGAEANLIAVKAILELPREDVQTVSAEQIITECTAYLQAPKGQEPQTVARVLLSRARAYSRLGEWKAARGDYKNLLELYPNDVDARLFYAADLAAFGLKDEAEREMERVLKVAPSSAEAYAVIGSLLAEKGDYATGIENCSKAIGLDGRCYIAFYNRALCYYRQGKPLQCFEDLSRLLKMQPIPTNNHPENVYDLRGRALLCLGRPQDALASFLMAQKLNPSSVEVAWGLWQSYTKLGKHHMACLLAQDLVRRLPKSSKGFIAFAHSLAAVGRDEAAISACEKAVVLEPNNVNLHVDYGVVLATIGKYREALNQFDEAIRHDPQNIRAMTSKVALLASCADARIRNGPRARGIALKLFLLDSSLSEDPECIIALAMAQAECGEFREAELLARKAVARAGPDHYAKAEYERRLKCFQAGRPFIFESREFK